MSKSPTENMNREQLQGFLATATAYAQSRPFSSIVTLNCFHEDRLVNLEEPDPVKARLDADNRRLMAARCIGEAAQLVELAHLPYTSPEDSFRLLADSKRALAEARELLKGNR